MTILVLHYSDTHFGRPSTEVDEQTVVEPFIEDVSRMAEKFGRRPDLIVFSGDLVFGSQPASKIEAQFESGRRFLERTASGAGGSIESIPHLVVPGNHDVDRTRIGVIQSQWFDALGKNADAASVIESEMARTTADLRQFVARQDAWKAFRNALPDYGIVFDDALGLSFGTMVLQGTRFGLLGLNSSWASESATEKGRLWVGRHQIDKGLDQVRGAEFKLVCSHHPPSWLSPDDEAHVQKRIESETEVFLHGHEHTAWYRAGGGHLDVAAGATYQGARRPNGYNWIELDVVEQSATIHLRRLNTDGKYMWTGHHIVGKTDVNGIAALPSVFRNPNASIENTGHHARARRVERVLEPGNVSEFPSSLKEALPRLEDGFKFRWERMPGEWRSHVVYWPMRERRPNAIHAFQCAAAASLQRCGAKICLWLDDLGEEEHGAEQFVGKVRMWLERCGCDWSRVEVSRFGKELDDRPGEPWPLVQKWLALSKVRLDDVFRVSKLVQADLATTPSYAELGNKRPRRLLSPTVVWTFRGVEGERAPEGSGVITLGGHDEKILWDAWSTTVPNDGRDAGHLYIPQLSQMAAGLPRGPMHMETASPKLTWTSKEDIRASLALDIGFGGGPQEWASTTRLAGWAFAGCVLLPRLLRGDTSPVVVDGRELRSVDELALIEPAAAPSALATLIAEFIV